MKLRANLSKIFALGGLAAGLILPASALAEYYVPPGNSAANQYTESLPSAGGEKGGRSGGGTSSPSKSLGSKNAQRLEAQGPAGEAAAEVAALTAPPATLVAADGGGQAKGQGGTGSRSQGGKQGPAQKQSSGPAQPIEKSHVNQPSGSSGIGEVVAQASGASDGGNLGLWLPLVIVATIAGTIGYRLRQRQSPTA
jgi:hypothetical protein